MKTKGKLEFYFAKDSHVGYYYVAMKGGHIIANKIMSKSDAEFICKAVENHDRLIEALKKIVVGTNDELPPYTIMSREELVKIAIKALKEVA